MNSLLHVRNIPFHYHDRRLRPFSPGCHANPCTACGHRGSSLMTWIHPCSVYLSRCRRFSGLATSLLPWTPSERQHRHHWRQCSNNSAERLLALRKCSPCSRGMLHSVTLNGRHSFHSLTNAWTAQCHGGACSGGPGWKFLPELCQNCLCHLLPRPPPVSRGCLQIQLHRRCRRLSCPQQPRHMQYQRQQQQQQRCLLRQQHPHLSQHMTTANSRLSQRLWRLSFRQQQPRYHRCPLHLRSPQRPHCQQRPRQLQRLLQSPHPQYYHCHPSCQQPLFPRCLQRLCSRRLLGQPRPQCLQPPRCLWRQQR